MKDLQNIRLLPITVILLIAFNIMNLIQFLPLRKLYLTLQYCFLYL